MKGIWIPFFYRNSFGGLSSYVLSLEKGYPVFVPVYDLLSRLREDLRFWGEGLSWFSSLEGLISGPRMRVFIPYIPIFSLGNVRRRSLPFRIYDYGEIKRMAHRLSLDGLIGLGEKSPLGSSYDPFVRFPGGLYGVVFFREDKLFSSHDDDFNISLKAKFEEGRGKSSRLIANCYLLRVRGLSFHVVVVERGRIRDVFT